MTNEEKDKLKALASKWQSMQVEYLQIAKRQKDQRHAAKYNGWAIGVRNCGTDLRKLIEELNQ